MILDCHGDNHCFPLKPYNSEVEHKEDGALIREFWLTKEFKLENVILTPHLKYGLLSINLLLSTPKFSIEGNHKCIYIKLAKGGKVLCSEEDDSGRQEELQKRQG